MLHIGHWGQYFRWWQPQLLQMLHSLKSWRNEESYNTWKSLKFTKRLKNGWKTTTTKKKNKHTIRPLWPKSLSKHASGWHTMCCVNHWLIVYNDPHCHSLTDVSYSDLSQLNTKLAVCFALTVCGPLSIWLVLSESQFWANLFDNMSSAAIVQLSARGQFDGKTPHLSGMIIYGNWDPNSREQQFSQSQWKDENKATNLTMALPKVHVRTLIQTRSSTCLNKTSEMRAVKN